MKIASSVIISGVLALLPLCIAGQTVWAELPTYAEAVLAYRESISHKLPIAVEWITKEHQTNESYDSRRVEVNSMKRVLASRSLEPLLEQAVRRQLSDEEAVLSQVPTDRKAVPLVTRHYFWTDGIRYHYRTSRNRNLDRRLERNYTDDVLVNDFADVNVYSLDPGRTPKLRAWQGLAGDGKTMTGYVGTHDIGGMTYRAFLPPLGVIVEEFRHNQFYSAADRWLDHSPEVEAASKDSQGRVTLRGACRNRTASPSGDASIYRFAVTSDPDKGFMPVRFELGFAAGDVTVDNQPEFPERLVETVDLEYDDNESGLYYPKRVIHTTYGSDPQWRAAHPGGADRKSPIPRVAFYVRVEEILSVRTKYQLDEKWMELPFPAGTLVTDADRLE